MAVGYILARESCNWTTIHNPSFVFTSPNMDQGITAGTRSHVVPGEIPLALWMEDSTTNKMYRIMTDQDTLEYCDSGSYGHFKTINYDDYKIEAYTCSEDIPTVSGVIYVDEFPSFSLPKSYQLDVFNETSVDTSKWMVYNTSNSSISIVSETLEIQMASISSQEYARCVSTLTMENDFSTEVTLSIDFSNISDATSDARLGVRFDGTSDEIYIQVRRDDIQAVSTFFGNFTYTKFSNTDINTRLVRYGNKIDLFIAQDNASYRLYKTFENAPTSRATVEIGMSVYSSSAPVFSWFDNFIITDYLSVVLPNQSIYDDRFYVDSYTPRPHHWYKLIDNLPVYTDSLDSINLTASGITRLFRSDINNYVPRFDGSGIITSDLYISLADNFSISLFVDSDGLTCGGESEFFNECQNIINITADDNTYVSIGTTDTNTLYYKVKTDVSTFGSDTGITLTSGTLESLAISVDHTNGIDFYYNGSNVSSINSAVGTVSSGILSIGNINKGTGSKFHGEVSDIKITTSGVISKYDANRLYNNGPLVSTTPAIYGTAIGSVVAEKNKSVFFGYPDFKDDLYLSTSLHIILEFGEAYNCYITAWDDTSHSTTSNVIFDNQLLKLSAAVFRSTNSSGQYPGSNVSDVNNTYVVVSVVSDMPVKGDDYIFGKFNTVYYTGISSHIGDVISVRPRISEVNKTYFPPGNYDFVITFHYQYT